MRHRRYPNYKVSGVEWLGEVPAHWEVKRLKYAADYLVSNVDKVPQDDEQPVRLCNYTDVYYHDHIHPAMGLMETTATGEEIRRFGLRVWDVLVTKDSEEWSDIAVPALVVETAPDLVCGYHLAIVRSRPGALKGPFVLRAFQTGAINLQFQLASNGVTRYGLPNSAIGAAWMVLPPLDEQRAIADFLDASTAKIDALMAKKTALIERLKEKRTALITRTVTRGLPPEAARDAGLAPHPGLKPSGIDWIGAVPDHWTIKPLKRAVRFLEGPGILAVDFVDDGVPLLRISGIGSRFATLDGCNYLTVERVQGSWSHFRVRLGDLLISGSASTGFCSEVDEVAQGAVPYTGIIIVRPRRLEAARDFVRWMFLSDEFAAQAHLAKTGSTIQHFGPTHLARMVVALPPLPEQQCIAAYLDRETARIDALVAKVEEAIERLQEYRTALISAAVTGRIDVRSVAATADYSCEVPA